MHYNRCSPATIEQAPGRKGLNLPVKQPGMLPKKLPKKFTGGVVVLLLSLLIVTLPTHASGTLLFRQVTPVDAYSGVMTVQDVLVQNGRIVSMGENLRAPSSAAVIEGQGKFLIPGLWDMHVHLSYDERFVDIMPDLFLDYGITSVRDTGGNLEKLLPLLSSHYRIESEAPRVFFAGPLLDGSPVVYEGNEGTGLGQSYATPEEARAIVNELREAGVDFIKIYEMVSPEVFQVFVAEASKHGLPIAAHVPLAMLASDAGPQVQSMEHLRNLEMDCADDAEVLLEQRILLLDEGRKENTAGMVLRSNIHKAQRDPAIGNEDPTRCDRVLNSLTHTIQVPTSRLNAMTQHPPFAEDDWPRALDGLPIAISKEWIKASTYMDPIAYKALGDWTLAMIPRLAAKNVPIGAGTDTPIGWAIPGYSLHRELELLVKAGLDRQAALAAATLVPAQFFHREATMGQVAVGFEADLLLLDANPLVDIRHTRLIRTVISRGKVVRDRPTIN